MTHASRLARAARPFLRDQSGSVTVEAVLILPLLIWAHLATWVFFDGYRSQAVNIRTAATIGDVLSRQSNPITPEFMDSLFQLQSVLIETTQPRQFRVTAFRYDPEAERYWVVWSETRGDVAKLTDAGLNAMEATIPELTRNERGILTETWVDYVPPASVGLGDLTFHHSVVTRPRYTAFGPYCWNSDNDEATWSDSTNVC